MIKLNKRRGELLAHIELFCASMPQQRSRHSGKRNIASLDSQAEIIEHLMPYQSIRITEPVIIDVEYSYKDLSRVLLFDVDNLKKATFDNLQRVGILSDDALVMGSTDYKEVLEHDFTDIKIYKVQGILCSLLDAISKKLFSPR